MSRPADTSDFALQSNGLTKTFVNSFGYTAIALVNTPNCPGTQAPVSCHHKDEFNGSLALAKELEAFPSGIFITCRSRTKAS
jgi:hypothetical protein